MAVLDCAVDLETPTFEATKPPRLNFARRCVYCLERDCDSPDCQALYERSRWAVCPECDGREGDEVTSEACDRVRVRRGRALADAVAVSWSSRGDRRARHRRSCRRRARSSLASTTTRRATTTSAGSNVHAVVASRCACAASHGMPTPRRVRSCASSPARASQTACCSSRAATAAPSVCAPCSEVYRGDAWQLVVSGLRGGKGVPESVACHPLVFATFTAPSFGPVHTIREVNGKQLPCRPRSRGETCPHGRSLACGSAP